MLKLVYCAQQHIVLIIAYALTLVLPVYIFMHGGCMDLKTISQDLRKKAASFLKAAEALEAVLALDSKETIADAYPQFYKNDDIKMPGTRLDQLRELVKKHGSMSLGEIVKAGIPRGTASSLVKEKNGFAKDFITGKWMIDSRSSN